MCGIWADVPEQRTIDPEQIKKFFVSSLPPTKMLYPLSKLAKDVVMMAMCLAGIP